MTSATKKAAVRDLVLNLEVHVKAAPWAPRFKRLKNKIRQALELSLISQNKLRLKADVYELSLILTDDRDIQTLNRKHRGQNKPTNVLSFPLAEGMLPFPDQSLPLGDIVIALETLERESKAENKRFADHFIHLVVHGMLHLCGYDHMRPGQARSMERLERSILAELDIPDPYR